MKTNPNHLHREVFNKAQQNKHIIMGYVFLSLVFMGAISSVYYWENKTKARSVIHSPYGHVESGEQEETPVVTEEGKMCAQVVTYARHKNSGEVRPFPTPCHVVENWEIIKN
ncbi:MAG TPA: hypothetical protein VEC17_01200 [Candidatus Binatia bacterium]|nr:hypothetical protein [Candidatus Binatia bacterium]